MDYDEDWERTIDMEHTVLNCCGNCNSCFGRQLCENCKGECETCKGREFCFAHTFHDDEDE